MRNADKMLKGHSQTFYGEFEGETILNKLLKIVDTLEKDTKYRIKLSIQEI